MVKEFEEINFNHKVTQTIVPLKGELIAKLVAPRKMIINWDVSETPKRIIELYFNTKFEDLVLVARIYDVTDLIFNGKNANHFYEITVPFHSGHWFIKGLEENRSYITEIGFYLSAASFFPLFRSNCIQTQMNKFLNKTDIDQNFLLAQHCEHQSPKWIDHVSTYSFYLKSPTLEGKNE